MKKLIIAACVILISGLLYADNSYFESSTYNVTEGTRARSTHINNPINAIEAGFDAVETAMNLKAPSASPTLVTPNIGTPSAGTLTNCTGLPLSTGISGLAAGTSTFLATPSSANLATAVTDETGTGSLVFSNSPTLVTPNLGTPSALVGTNITGTAAGLTAGSASTVITNANLTGPITSVGNMTSVNSQTGTGSTFVMSAAPTITSPTLVTPALGTPASGTLSNCDAANEGAKGVIELATTTEAQAGTDTSRAVTPAGLNSVVLQHAKTQLINSVYDIVTPANVRLFLVFDQTGAVSTITDRSTIGGATAHTATLRDGSLNAINASTCTPGVSGLAPYLTLDATHLWNTPDAADLSFIEPQAFSIFALANLSNLATPSAIMAKAAAGQLEYVFETNASGQLSARLIKATDGTTRVGRIYNTTLTGGSFGTYGMTYDGSAASSGIDLYLNGAVVDDTDDNNGSYTTMVNGTALPGSYYSAGNFFRGKMSVLLVVAEELDAVQAKRLDAVLRGYAGVTY